MYRGQKQNNLQQQFSDLWYILQHAEKEFIITEDEDQKTDDQIWHPMSRCGSLIDTIDCEFRAPFGVGSATAKRLCLPGVSGLNQTTANV